MFSKKKGVTETSQIVQATCFWFRWLIALGSQSVYGRVDSDPTANSQVILLGGGWAEAHYL